MARSATMPVIPDVPAGIDAALTAFLKPIKVTIDTREGRIASSGDQLVTFNILSDLGIDVNSRYQIPSTPPTSRITGDSIPPGIPTDFTVLPVGINSHRLQWTNPSDKDLWAVEVWYSNTNDITTSALLAVVTIPDAQRGQQSAYTHSGIDSTLGYHYWLRSKDWSGNLSNFAAVGTVVAADNPSLGDLIADLTGIIDYAQLSLDLQGDIDLAAGLDGKLVLSNNVDGHVSGVVLVNDGTTSDFTIVCDKFKIVNNSDPGNITVPFVVGTIDGTSAVGISGALLVDGSILARSIAAGSITADRIAVGTLTPYEMAPGTVPIWQGTYSAATVYEKGDAVFYNGSSFTYINDTPGAGHTPADDSYWDFYAQAGTSGSSGYNAATLVAYLRSATTPGTTPGALTYTFSTADWTPGNSWSKTVPSGTDPVWAVAVTAYSNTDTNSILSTDWSAPVQVFANGETGASGLNVATAYLYQRTASSTAPTAMPTAALTFTFATGAITGTPGNSWTAAIPALDASKPYLWVTTATASNTAATDSIAVGEWAASRLLSQDGSAGTAARSVSLTANDQATIYDVEGERDTPFYTYVYAEAYNTSGTVYYEFVLEGTTVQNTTASSYTYYPPDTFAEMPQKIEVNIREGASSGTILASDSMTFFGVRAGASAITVGNSNAAHVLPASSEGTVSSYAGSGTILSVWEGATQLSYSTSGNSTWNVVSAVGSSITVGTPSTVGQTRVYGNHSAMTADLATVTYTIAVRNAGGATQTFTVLQSFSKSKAGVDGADGADGAEGAPGPGVVYRGAFAAGTYYYTAKRRDIVSYSGSYYLYNVPTSDSGASESSWSAGDWTAFGATFSSVATDILLAVDATILKYLTIGSTGGLRSTGKDSYADTTAGYWLGYDSSAYKLNIGNSTDYIKWTGSALSIASSSAAAITISGAGGITLNSGGGVTVNSGGNIKLVGASYDPGMIVLYGSSYSTEFYTILNGASIHIRPTIASAVTLYFGDPSTDRRYSAIVSYANTFSIVAYTTCNIDCPDFDLDASDDIFIDAGDNISITAADLLTLTADDIICTGQLRPEAANTRDCGTATYYWRGVCSDDYYYKTTGTLIPFDHLDDLAIIDSAKPKINEVTGKEALDVSGFPDDFFMKDDAGNVNREWMCNKNVSTLLIGAVKQANKVITEDVIEQFNAMIEDHQQRIAKLEAQINKETV